MHPITSYRTRTETTKVALAKALGITRAYVWAIERNGRKPGRALAVRIERLTEGEIKVEDWDDFAPTRPGLAVARPVALSHVGSPMAVAGGTR